MKRLLVAVLGLLVFVSLSTSVAHASVSDFVITDYGIKYELSRDSENRSVLVTTETITAQFPQYDQNHGIERALPQSYQSHPTNLKIDSITKPDGSSWEYSTSTSSDNLVVRIGSADSYVHGAQTYVLKYTQHDVTGNFSDTNRDEFYWDTNGTQWRVPIDSFSATLAISGALTERLAGDTACYQGAEGSNQTCTVSTDNAMFSVSAKGLAPGKNVTLAVGFEKGTFSEYKQSLWDNVVSYHSILSFVTGVAGVGVAAWVIWRANRWSGRKSEIGTIAPEYTPPRDVSLTAAASLSQNPGSVFTAQLLDLAVRHYVKIYQTREKSLFRRAEYDLEIVHDIGTLKPEEQEILRDIFSGNVGVGVRLKMKSLQNNTTVYNSTRDNEKKLTELVRGEYGLRERNEVQSAWFKRMGYISAILTVVLLNPWLLLPTVVAFIAWYVHWPLTDKGLAIQRYLLGLKMYIGVAEAERIRMLQSPEGALRVGPMDANDQGSLLKLYESVLPFAVLFGQEKEWSKRIGELYQSVDTSPSWYSGVAVFNAASLSSGIGGFSSAATYSSANSSSSGGSGGGGSSGGGGGGGGGGGW